MATSVEQKLAPRPAARCRTSSRPRLDLGARQLARAVRARVRCLPGRLPRDATRARPATSRTTSSLRRASPTTVDLDLRNDYASRERTLEGRRRLSRSATSMPPSTRNRASCGRSAASACLCCSRPAVGLGGLTGARLVMVLIAALLADQLYRLLRDLGSAGGTGSWPGSRWSSVFRCSSFPARSTPSYPARCSSSSRFGSWCAARSSPAALALGSAAAAALVWLHVRYLPLSLGVLLGLAIAACRGPPERGAGEHRKRGLAARVRSAALARRRDAPQWRRGAGER